MEKTKTIQSVKDIINLYENDVKLINDKLWDYAETAYSEFKSVVKLCEALEAEDFHIEWSAGKIPTAFKAKYGFGKPVIGILAEYDAIKGLNQMSESAIKQPTSTLALGKNGHGSGNNISTAIAYATCLAVKSYLDENEDNFGTIVFYGCPASEGEAGKTYMAREGVFDGCDIGFYTKIGTTNHVISGRHTANCKISYKFNSSYENNTEENPDIKYLIKLMNIGVSTLQKNIPNSTIVSTIIKDGEYQCDTIQKYAEVIYSIYASDNKSLNELLNSIDSIAHSTSIFANIKMIRSLINSSSDVVPNRILEDVLYKNAKNIKLPNYTDKEKELASKLYKSYEDSNSIDLAAKLSTQWKAELEEHYNSKGYSINNFLLSRQHFEDINFSDSDIGDVSWKIPLAGLSVAAYPAKAPIKSWQCVAMGKTTIAHKSVFWGAEVLANTIIEILENPEETIAAKKEHQRMIENKEYECIIPKDKWPKTVYIK